MSEKGYTDAGISLAWFKLFELDTHEKSNGNYWVLFLDGHSSHLTTDFIDYAIEHSIILVCSPPHGTHVYQTLDVGIFGVLKMNWGEACRKWAETHLEKIGKNNFFGIYGAVHTTSLTPSNIKSAWRKAGIVPFNPDVVSHDMLAPSLPSSTLAIFPIDQPSPVKKLHRIMFPRSTPNPEIQSTSNSEPTPTPTLSWDPNIDPSLQSQGLQEPSQATIVEALQQTSYAHLVSETPAHGSSLNVPMLAEKHIPPPACVVLNMQAPYQSREVLQDEVQSLKLALWTAMAHIQARDNIIEITQTQMVLQTMENTKMRRTLLTSEKSTARKKTDAQVKLAANGLGRILTTSSYQSAMKARKAEIQAEKMAKEAWKVAAREWCANARQKRNVAE